MKLNKIVFSALLISMMTNCLPLSTYAAEPYSLGTNPTSINSSSAVYTLRPFSPTDHGNISIQGANPPSKKADIHNLSKSNYNYQATNMGFRLYTSKWLTGSSSLYVTVSNWKVIEQYNGAESKKLTIKVYNSKKKKVDSKDITIGRYNSGSASFSGLSADSKYYVCFETPTNSNRYSFDGTISG